MSVGFGTYARRCAWLIPITLWLLSTSSVLAQSSADAALVEQAEQLSSRGDHQAALALVRVVIERAPTPRAYGVLGLASLRSDDPVGAEAAVQRALQTPGDSWVASHKADLNAALVAASRVLGTVVVDNAAEGAIVHVNDREVGIAPLPPLRVRAGTLVVAIGLVHKTVAVTPGTTSTIDFGSTATTTPNPAAPLATTAAVDPPRTPIEPPAGASQPAAANTIPASWLQAFAAGPEHPPARSSGWTDNMRVHIGLGLGVRRAFRQLDHREDSEAGTSIVTFYDDDATGPVWTGPIAGEVTLSAGWIMGISHYTELAARFDLGIVPSAIAVRGYWKGPGIGDDETLFGNAWSLATVLTPGFRFRPLRSARTVHLGTALRLGLLSLFGDIGRYHCRSFDELCRPDSETPTERHIGTRSVGTSMLLVGGEVVLGATLGDDASWDVSLRVRADNMGVAPMISLERRVY